MHQKTAEIAKDNLVKIPERNPWRKNRGFRIEQYRKKQRNFSCSCVCCNLLRANLCRRIYYISRRSWAQTGFADLPVILCYSGLVVVLLVMGVLVIWLRQWMLWGYSHWINYPLKVSLQKIGEGRGELLKKTWQLSI